MTFLRRFARLLFLVRATVLASPVVWACPTDMAHAAMIFGMVDPTLLTGQAGGAMGAMPGMQH